MSNYFNGNDIYGDCLIMESILDEIQFYSGTERKKMLKVSPNIGGSMLYGLTWRAFLKRDKDTGAIITRKKDPLSGLYLTKIMVDYPQLELVFKEFQQNYFPDFEYNQTQFNRNYPCPPHFDSQNCGTSVLISLGDFTGGETCVEFEDGVKELDSHNKPVRFNGSKYKHWVKDYEGTRYSLVFFNRFSKKLNVK